ncbi:hypothetical protein C6P40_001766 [Pichia californica]|uniref:RRM domain-containing protein n=1 Tax=Pichia californica TaxID=460514 RepID=A0A9P6WJ29_9ASCO|nr:hypothetical protein C6P40_001766 [[Candida] californica]
MSSLLEKSLDDIIGQQKPNRRFNKKSFRGGKVGKSFHRGGKGRTTLSRRNNNNNNNNNIGNPKEIRISNLHPDLTNDDLSKLMTTIGPTVKVNLIFNTHGKSTGIAFIEFQHIEDARKAIENFDGRLAAGQTIRVTSTVPINERISLALPQQNQNQLKSKKKNNQKNSIDKQKHKRKPRPTFEDLDNELDNYMNGDNTSNNDNNDNIIIIII